MARTIRRWTSRRNNTIRRRQNQRGGYNLNTAQYNPAIDFYNVLGVSNTASDGEIKKSYKKLQLIWHPDKNKPNAIMVSPLINEIYAFLSSNRSLYDRRRNNYYKKHPGEQPSPVNLDTITDSWLNSVLVKETSTTTPATETKTQESQPETKSGPTAPEPAQGPAAPEPAQEPAKEPAQGPATEPTQEPTAPEPTQEPTAPEPTQGPQPGPPPGPTAPGPPPGPPPQSDNFNSSYMIHDPNVTTFVVNTIDSFYNLINYMKSLRSFSNKVILFTLEGCPYTKNYIDSISNPNHIVNVAKNPKYQTIKFINLHFDILMENQYKMTIINNMKEGFKFDSFPEITIINKKSLYSIKENNINSWQDLFKLPELLNQVLDGNFPQNKSDNFNSSYMIRDPNVITKVAVDNLSISNIIDYYKNIRSNNNVFVVLFTKEGCPYTKNYIDSVTNPNHIVNIAKNKKYQGLKIINFHFALSQDDSGNLNTVKSFFKIDTFPEIIIFGRKKRATLKKDNSGNWPDLFLLPTLLDQIPRQGPAPQPGVESTAPGPAPAPAPAPEQGPTQPRKIDLPDGTYVVYFNPADVGSSYIALKIYQENGQFKTVLYEP